MMSSECAPWRLSNLASADTNGPSLARVYILIIDQ